MDIIQRLQQSRILVAGLGQTGCSFARWLNKNSLSFDVWDSRLRDQVAIDEVFENRPMYFADDSLQNYDIVLLSPGVEPRHPSIEQQKQNGAEILGDVALFAKLSAFKTIAITSTNGKSTVVDWCGALLRAAGKKVVVAGNIGTPVLDCLDADEDSIFVIELSSFQLETLHNLSAHIAICLNITPDHLDRYNSFAEYKNAKVKIFEGAEYSIYPSNENFEYLDQSDDFAVVGKQNKYLAELSKFDAEVGLIGKHNRKNAMVIAQIASILNIKQSTTEDVLKSYAGLAHRCQLVGCYSGVRYINDSKATNVDAVKAALADFDKNNVIVLIGGVSKDPDISDLSESLNRASKQVIFFGRDGKALSASVDLNVGFQYCESLEQAVRVAQDLAETGDNVLLSPACASFDEFRNFEHRGEAFKQYVEACNV